MENFSAITIFSHIWGGGRGWLKAKRKNKEGIYTSMTEIRLLLASLSGKASVRGQVANKANQKRNFSLRLGGHWLLSFISIQETSSPVMALSHGRSLKWLPGRQSMLITASHSCLVLFCFKACFLHQDNRNVLTKETYRQPRREAGG